MKVSLTTRIDDVKNHRCINVYRQDDGQWFILITPMNPSLATAENVLEYHNVSFEAMTEIVFMNALPQP